MENIKEFVSGLINTITEVILGINPFIYVGIALLLMIAIFFNLVAKKRRDIQEEKSVQREVELSDRLFRPAQVSIKFIYREIEESINKYIKAEYNNNPMMLPEKMDMFLHENFIKEVNRLNKIGVQKKIIHFTPEERYHVEQDNSSFYAVQFVNVDVNYHIEYFTEHATFRKYVKQDVYRKVIFEGTNDMGWVLKEVSEEEVSNVEEQNV